MKVKCFNTKETKKNKTQLISAITIYINVIFKVKWMIIIPIT